MNKQRLVIDYSIYEVDEILEGGMGRVLLLTRLKRPLREGTIDRILESSEFLSDHFLVSDRDKLAAKTVKEKPAMPSFQRECEIWLTFSEPGIVPLLKVVKVNNELFALMPRYAGNLREIIVGDTRSPRLDLLKMLAPPVRGLSALHERHGVVHQDIKPENLLFTRGRDGPSFLVSDWGMANVHASIFSTQNRGLSEFALESMSGWGTLPYMSPERFVSYRTNVSADIFSLGIVFYEIITGEKPYHRRSPIPEQIISGEFHHTAATALEQCPLKVSDLVLGMIHPDQARRLCDYKRILKLIHSL